MATFFSPQGGRCEEARQLYNLVHFVSCVMLKCTSLSTYQCKSRGGEGGVRARGGDLMPETIPMSGF